MSQKNVLVSIIVPIYNEADSIVELYKRSKKALSSLEKVTYEFWFIDDSSSDESEAILSKLARNNDVHFISFSRNFGKEIAVSAGLSACAGDAAILIDGDLQHPPEKIPELIRQWQKTKAPVVTGLRKNYDRGSLSVEIGSTLFYKLFNAVSEVKLNPDATDFRLLDRQVINEYNRFTERNRIARGLIDWMNFKQAYIEFEVADRNAGVASYSFFKRIRLAINSFISLSLIPLKLAGWLGIIITVVSGLFGIYIITDRYILGDPFNLNFSGTAILATLSIFLIGIVLMCIGLVALYIAHIHTEVANRPLYVIKKQK